MGETQKTINFCGKQKFTLFSPPFSFLCTSIVITYILIIHTCNPTIIIFEPCALNANFSISHLDLIKFPYFVHTTRKRVLG